tara:strand:+ start:4743 stop:5945 length:1203 start_codon:yes stop_codon:yes gene_type:complete
MSKREFLDFGDMLDQGLEVFGEAIRRAFGYDAYAGQNKFPAVVLSPPIPITAGQAGLFTKANRPKTPIKKEELFAGVDAALNKIDKFFFRARIIGPNSPHDFLPDPCQYDVSESTPPDTIFKLISMHTLFVSSDDYQLGTGAVFPTKGSIVLVELDQNQFGYNLEVGRFLKVLTKTNTYFNVDNLLTENCVSSAMKLDFSGQKVKLDLSALRAGAPAAATPLKISAAGKAFLGGDEGKRFIVYDDKTGKPVASFDSVEGRATIGVGHLIREREKSEYSKYLLGANPGKMTEKQVQDLWTADIEKHSVMRNWIKKPVSQEMFDALVSLAFNTGPNHSAVKKCVEAINKEDYAAAAMAIANGPTQSLGDDGVLRAVPGLVKRRAREANHFVSAGYPGPASST